LRLRRAGRGNARPLNCGVRRMFRLIAIFLAASLVGCTSARIPVPIEVCAQISDASEKASCESQVTAIRPSTNLGLVSAFGWLPFLWYAAYYVMGIVFGRFVYVDARRREWLAFRVKPLWWAALCVFDPAMGALVYWVLHYSRLARRGYA
jgi:hypothetical protein